MGKPMFNFEIKADFKRRLVVSIPNEYYLRIKAYAAENHIPMVNVMRDFLKDLYAHYENNQMMEYLNTEDVGRVGVENWHPAHFSVNNSELEMLDDILEEYKVTLPKLFRLYLKRRFEDA